MRGNKLTENFSELGNWGALTLWIGAASCHPLRSCTDSPGPPHRNAYIPAARAHRSQERVTTFAFMYALTVISCHCCILATKYWPQNTCNKILATKYWPQITGCKILATKYWQQNYWPQNTCHKILATKYWPQNTGHKILAVALHCASLHCDSVCQALTSYWPRGSADWLLASNWLPPVAGPLPRLLWGGQPY